MAVSATSGVGSAQNSGNQSTASPSSSSLNLTQGQFLQILTAQLQNQDPSNPVSATDFTTQLAQFSTVSGISQLNTSIQQLVTLQQLTQGASLVGKTVQYGTPGSGNAGNGVVTSINLSKGNMTLQIGGQNIPVAQVTAVLQSAGGS